MVQRGSVVTTLCIDGIQSMQGFFQTPQETKVEQWKPQSLILTIHYKEHGAG